MASKLDKDVKHFAAERLFVIQTLALQSRRLGRAPPAQTGNNNDLYIRLDRLLTWLDNVEMTSELNTKAQLELGLGLLCKRSEYHFPADVVDRANTLYDKFEQIRWGKGPEIKVEDEGDDVKMEDVSDDGVVVHSNHNRPSSTRRHSASFNKSHLRKASDATPGVKLPPSDHPIWGTSGIMYGVAPTVGKAGRKGLMLDERYHRRDAKVYGHNGIEVGAWFPRQLVALFHGAHGHHQAGIFGDAQHGAWSIVVSGHYDTLDEDQGGYLYYSGSNSHDNDDPKAPNPSSLGTLALKRSYNTRQPVRVLRAESKNSKWAPLVGIRYDGLYQVVSQREPFNDKGGKYEQFRLERVEHQAPIDKRRPNAKDHRDFDKINNLW